jgi:hypothetical protein
MIPLAWVIRIRVWIMTRSGESCIHLLIRSVRRLVTYRAIIRMLRRMRAEWTSLMPEYEWEVLR